MNTKKLLLTLLSCSGMWCMLASSHGAMFKDYYKFDNSNEGLTAAQIVALQGNKALAANQCVNGSANGYPCRNVDLQAFLAKADMGGGSQNLNDIWGWTDPVNGNEIAIVGRTNGTAFVNISDPENPVHIGFLRSHNNGTSSWRDIKVYNDHAFIVADSQSTHGLQVYDMRQLRNTQPNSTLTETAHFNGFGSAHNIAINEDTGFAYIVGSNQCSGGLYMVDVSSPQAPSYAGCFSSDGYTHDAQCVIYNGPDVIYQGREICVGYNEDTITIVDVSDKSNPVQLSRSGYSGSRYTHQGWFLNDNHSILIMNDELDEQRSSINTTSYIWDVSDLDNPNEIGRYVGPTPAVDHNLYTLNNYVIETNYRAGMRILRTTEIENGVMTEAAYFDTIPGSNSAQFSGTWSNYPYFASGNIVLSDIGTGLFIVKPDWQAIDNDTPPPISYCDASGNNASEEWIGNVEVGNFSNPSGSSQYSDFTAMSVAMSIGNNAITLTPEFAGTSYNEYWKIWIDFDANGTFDASEEVFDSGGASSAIVNGNITIPSDAAGSTRMRVAMRYNAAPSACGSFNYGEVEDYTVTFDGDPPPPPPTCSVEENFESGLGGWTTSGSCSTGTFITGTPDQVVNGGVTTQVGGAQSGNSALFTQPNSGGAGSDDVDGGECVVTSPAYNVATTSDVSLYYFHGQRDAGDDANDGFNLELSVNGGSYQSLVSIGDQTSNAAWTLENFTSGAGTIQIRARVADATGGGDLIEAGIDNLKVCAQQ
ncbi:choice-of-anchor B family protein [Aliikangiella marina]|uniref:Choice-of-anchor B family protein n=1 Tax=Aliikangiella marina TaxID=1712262 RepID=A0A545TEB0_9GAMM|nr:choice-of-anchor B family protein [Aliikangiella marina]TQV75506.1 choice-of-anchor B family protein [Aliikangiella marina]